MDDFKKITIFVVLGYYFLHILQDWQWKTLAVVLNGILEFMDIAKIQEKLIESGVEVSCIARIYQKQNGEEINIPMMLFEESAQHWNL